MCINALTLGLLTHTHRLVEWLFSIQSSVRTFLRHLFQTHESYQYNKNQNCSYSP